MLDISARTYLALQAIATLTGLWITRHGLLTAEPAGADIGAAPPHLHPDPGAVRAPGGEPQLAGDRPPVAGAALFLTAAHLAYGHHVGPYDLVVQLPTRGLALATFLVLLPLAELLADTVQVLRHRPGPGGARRPGVAAGQRVMARREKATRWAMSALDGRCSA